MVAQGRISVSQCEAFKCQLESDFKRKVANLYDEIAVQNVISPSTETSSVHPASDNVEACGSPSSLGSLFSDGVVGSPLPSAPATTDASGHRDHRRKRALVATSASASPFHGSCSHVSSSNTTSQQEDALQQLQNVSSWKPRHRCSDHLPYCCSFRRRC